LQINGVRFQKLTTKSFTTALNISSQNEIDAA